MKRITEFIAHETDGKSFKTNKFCLDSISNSAINYEEPNNISLNQYGETIKSKESIDLSEQSKKLEGAEPLFKYFLDGSRRTYKVDDVIYDKKVFPIIAGQIGVGCCYRENRQLIPDVLEMHNVIALPESADKDGNFRDNFFENLKNKISEIDVLKKRNISFSKILIYNEQTLQPGQRYENFGIAKIQDEMIEKEKRVVASLAKDDKLDQNSFLLKDGSLEYKKMKTGDYKDLSVIKSNYQCVIGASKSFNPEKCMDERGRSNASIIAKLPLYHRTPAYLYESEISGDVKFAIWYVRIRDSKFTYSPFDGILKLEKILISDIEQENGIETDLINIITANIINERNPVCYGDDTRWANHLYPIYMTEYYIKSKYLSTEYFLNLF
jgi:hypothetical protein